MPSSPTWTPPFFGGNKATRRDWAKGFADGAANMSVNVDGTPIPNIKGRFRAASPDFDFTIDTTFVLNVQ